MRKVYILLILISMPFHLFAQQKLSWDGFADVSFHDVYNVHYDEYFMKPTFGPNIQSYEGSKISIRGYFLDFSYKEGFYMVSRNPMSSCFFCGGAGPETIIEVNFKNKPKYKTDQVIVVVGILELNADDVDHCNYILKEATVKLVQ